MRWWNLQQLKSKDAAIRRQAVEKLATEGGEKATEPLINALKDSDAAVRVAAIRGLAEIDPGEANVVLKPCFLDPDPSVRAATAEVMKWCGTESAVEGLLKLLKDPAGTVRWQAVQSLDTLKWQPSSPAEHAWRWTALGDFEKAAIQGAAGVEALSLAMKDSVYYKRQAALEAMSQIGDARVVKPILTALKDEDKNVRATAIEALSLIGDHSAVSAVIKSLKDKDPHVRSAAVGALTKLGDPQAVEPLTVLLKDPNWAVRESAAKALGVFKNPASVQSLAEALGDSDREVREAAIRSLAEIGDPIANEPLVAALTDEEDSVRGLATTALRRLDRQWEHSNGARSAIPRLKAALKHKEYWVRQAAADVLGKVGEVRPVESSLAHLLNPSQMRRKNATDIFLRMLEDFDSDLRQAAADALGRIGDKKAITFLVPAMRDSSHWVCRSAARALRALHWSPTSKEDQQTQESLLAI